MEHLDLPLSELNNSGGDLLRGLSVSFYSQFWFRFLSFIFILFLLDLWFLIF